MRLPLTPLGVEQRAYVLSPVPGCPSEPEAQFPKGRTHSPGPARYLSIS